MTDSLPYRLIQMPQKTRGQHFTFRVNRDMRISMTNSYLCIITPRGLEKLVVETEHAAQFLFRRVARYPGGAAIACWAVLDGRTAADVMCHVSCRRFQRALDQFNARAIHLGTLLPDLADDDEMLTAS